MKLAIHFSILLVLSVTFMSAQSSSQTVDPFYTSESLPSTPETASLGEFGAIEATPYNGRVNANVPIYNLEWEGIGVPISLNYDTGGVQVASEASWVGLNWSLSPSYGIHRKIYGLDDFSMIEAEFIPDGINQYNGYIYNDIQPELIPGTDFEAQLSYSDIIATHYSFGLTRNSHYGVRNMDTQPDVFTARTLTNTYKFILKKKTAGPILQTQVFDSNNVIITYNLNTEVFHLIDEHGFEYTFGTKDYSTSFSGSSTFVYPAANPNGDSSPFWSPSNYWYNVFNYIHREDATVVTNWHVDEVESVRGRQLLFNYTEGLQFSFPKTDVSYSNGNGVSLHTNFTLEQVDKTGTPKVISQNVAAIENNYLTNITGDFGTINFNLGNRLDIATGSTVDNVMQEEYGGFTLLYTKINVIWDSHGTGNPHPDNAHLLPKKLNSVEVLNQLNEPIVNASFTYDYFNNDKINEPIPERYLRLKLNAVEINDKRYGFDYILPNHLEPKDSYRTDFWGFANGKNNTVSFPTIGRFIVTGVIPPSSQNFFLQGTLYHSQSAIVQSFYKFNGANRGSDFSFGKRGTLDKITYPTGGSTEFNYEPHEMVMQAPHPFEVTELYGNTTRFKWTNMTDEDKFDITYQYLKNAKDPNYNFYEIEAPIIQGDPTTVDIGYGQLFSVDFPSLITISGTMTTHGGAAGFSYWSNHPFNVIRNVDTGAEIPVFYFSDAPVNIGYDHTTSVSKPVNLPPGNYRIVRAAMNFPPGEDPSDLPPVPIIEYHSDEILLYTYETIPDLSVLFETFEIGGLRIKKIVNKGMDNQFLSAKEFEYTFPDTPEEIAASGVLMDDLIFHSKASGFHSYNPRAYADFLLTSHNQVGGNNSASGSHIGYSAVTEFNVDAQGQSFGYIERSYHNQKNEYFKESFDLPYGYDGIWRDKNNNGTVEIHSATGWWNAVFGNGNDDNELYYLQNAALNFPSDFILFEGTSAGWNCITPNCTNTNRLFSINGNARIENTVLLGLPLRLDFSYANGNVEEEKVYDKEGVLLRKTEHAYAYLNGNIDLEYYASFLNGVMRADYNTNNSNTLGVAIEHIFQQGVWGGNHHTYYAYQFPLHHALVSRRSGMTTFEYFDDLNLVNERSYEYDFDNHFNNKTIQTIGETDEYVSQIYYPYSDETFSDPHMIDLRSENRLSTTVAIERFKNGVKLSEEKNIYDKSSATGHITLAIAKEISKGPNGTAATSHYDAYDDQGNLLQVHYEDGTSTSFLWGYNQQYVIAQIQNASQDEIGQLNLGTIGNGLNEAQELNLRTNLPNAHITTYTYKPLVGLTSQKDPRGNTIYYHYDAENRLKYVKDRNGKILSKNEYNYGTNN